MRLCAFVCICVYLCASVCIFCASVCICVQLCASVCSGDAAITCNNSPFFAAMSSPSITIAVQEPRIQPRPRLISATDPILSLISKKINLLTISTTIFCKSHQPCGWHISNLGFQIKGWTVDKKDEISRIFKSGPEFYLWGQNIQTKRVLMRVQSDQSYLADESGLINIQLVKTKPGPDFWLLDPITP